MAKATSASETVTSWPTPVRVRWRSAASRPHGRGEAGGDVPRRQHVVGGQHAAGRAGGVGEARRRVDRVVDRGAAVGVAEDVDVDEVVAAGPQPLVGPASPPSGKFDRKMPPVGPGGGDQLGDQLLALGAAQVDGDASACPCSCPPRTGWCRRGCTGQRWKSMPPPMSSKRMTSAPSWASVMPPSGAATKADPSTTRRPSSAPTPDTLAVPGGEVNPARRPDRSRRKERRWSPSPTPSR